jgi:hypothetical protein
MVGCVIVVDVVVVVGVVVVVMVSVTWWSQQCQGLLQFSNCFVGDK